MTSPPPPPLDPRHTGGGGGAGGGGRRRRGGAARQVLLHLGGLFGCGPVHVGRVGQGQVLGHRHSPRSGGAGARPHLLDERATGGSAISDPTIWATCRAISSSALVGMTRTSPRLDAREIRRSPPPEAGVDSSSISL